MSNPVLSPAGVTERFKTHRSQLMTLWVTRQGQEFVTSGDLQLCDVELVNASVELVGEPGIGHVGNIAGETTSHKTTFNQLHTVNNAGTKSTVYNIEGENRILQKAHLNHGHLNISIQGMSQGHQFRKDISQAGNNLEFLVPTDLGLTTQRYVTWPTTPLMLENVHLQQNLKVMCSFAGSWPETFRLARFVEDWADSPAVQLDISPALTRNTDGTVRYTVNNDEGQASAQQCQVPANCVEAVKLVFKVTPRTLL